MGCEAQGHHGSKPKPLTDWPYPIQASKIRRHSQNWYCGWFQLQSQRPLSVRWIWTIFEDMPFSSFTMYAGRGCKTLKERLVLANGSKWYPPIRRKGYQKQVPAWTSRHHTKAVLFLPCCILISNFVPNGCMRDSAHRTRHIWTPRRHK